MTARAVVVVGGGIAGLTAAFELTDPLRCQMRSHGCRCREDKRHAGCSLPKVSVYEQRTELGGKGASVRNEALGYRIEEHGLHVWFGYYENAFRLLDRCHRELDEYDEPRWSSALTDVAQGFRRASTVGLADDDNVIGEWTRWSAKFPEDNALPWNRVDLDEPADFDLRWFLPAVGRRTTALLHAAMQSLLTDAKDAALADFVTLVDLALGDIDPTLDKLFSVALRYTSQLRRQSTRVPRTVLISLALTSLEASAQLLDYLRKSQDIEIAASPTARRLFTILDLIIGSTRGLLSAGIATDADIDRLDIWEWSEWLAANGVLGVSRDSALVRALSYCLPFAYEKGSRDLPSFSAAVGIRLFLRTFFTYRGALMWKMNYGMGEVVFAPLYELLRKRGVEFHFEHELSGIGVASASIKRLQFHCAEQQPAGDERWPLRSIELPEGSLCYWPLREQQARTKTIDIDTEDCDVVLALPLAAIVEAAPDFIKNTARWSEARHGRPRHDGEDSQGLADVATQSVQLWLTRPASDALGWAADITVSGFTEPFDTFSDMTHLLRAEPKPGTGPAPQGLVYLCSVKADQREGRADPPRTVADDLALFLARRAIHLWPAAEAQDDSGSLQNGLIIGVADVATLDQVKSALHAQRQYEQQSQQSQQPQQPQQPQQRAPFLRENTAPSERYSLSLPGTAALRIHPGNTGYDNLFVAGDWTACILNAGCIEAATISGMLAAEALLEQHLPIIGRSR